jgi:hypothetical protein
VAAGKPIVSTFRMGSITHIGLLEGIGESGNCERALPKLFYEEENRVCGVMEPGASSPAPSLSRVGSIRDDASGAQAQSRTSSGHFFYGPWTVQDPVERDDAGVEMHARFERRSH